MNGIVVDASITLSWCFPDEQTDLSIKVLDRLKAGEQALVPAFWSVEVLNTLLIGEKHVLTGTFGDCTMGDCSAYHDDSPGNYRFVGLQTHTNAGAVVNPPVPWPFALGPNDASGPNLIRKFGSWHTGGANFVLGDGSVRFLTNSMAFSIFQGMCSIQGGEVIGANF